jgi:CheY-like chemotaxis protein
MMLSAATFAASTFGRKVADDIAKQVWEHIKTAIKPLFGRDPVPEDVLAPKAQALIAEDKQLAPILSAYWRETSVLRRAHVASKALKGAKILWIDDHPAGNALERQALSSLGVVVTSVESTASAIACLKQESFDLILSDIARPGAPAEGVAALPQLLRVAPTLPVVFYVTQMNKAGTPLSAFGITNRPDDLMHLCMDALERRRL